MPTREENKPTQLTNNFKVHQLRGERQLSKATFSSGRHPRSEKLASDCVSNKPEKLCRTRR